MGTGRWRDAPGPGTCGWCGGEGQSSAPLLLAVTCRPAAVPAVGGLPRTFRLGSSCAAGSCVRQKSRHVSAPFVAVASTGRVLASALRRVLISSLFRTLSLLMDSTTEFAGWFLTFCVRRVSGQAQRALTWAR